MTDSAPSVRPSRVASTPDPDDPWAWFEGPSRRLPARRVRGLRPTVLPNWTLVGQTLGVLAALVGVLVLWGSGVALLVGGVVLAAICTLHEAGWLSAADPPRKT